MFKILAATLLLAASGPSFACGCNKPESIGDLDQTAVVFEGEAISHLIIRDSPGCNSNGIPVLSSGGEIVTFKVTKNLRGTTAEYINVRVNGNTSCDLQRFDFNRGDKYVLSIHLLQDQEEANDHDAYWNSICELRNRI
ncbi:hypothetical protein FNZ56_05235 [Pseudoluteimonas lycopersici]|uniref:Uncharacterized protein n=1 Tax=Pseudoluteimonas lycopersici TaxID=1324796 RepID=A0A516V444_9GAMM|nr:hypothetical protein [Lysobacter lycopersici]QDQ73315.1 hypothetical protein FNZ56_05235 [Lysobacter lycopersici]